MNVSLLPSPAAGSGLLFGAIVFVSIAIGGCTSKDTSSDRPEVTDDRLELTLFASDPDIVTPIGIAIDDQDRIFVLESHTHLRPEDYEGPDGDRIKIFKDPDHDGDPDDISVFADGLDDGMNIAFSPEGTLYLVSSRAVWALYDRDDDGVSEDREKVLEMVQPDYVYDHAGLMGIAFSHDGWMYVTRGNVGGGNWKLVGSDGSSVGGYGDGGNIMRARPDGSELEEVATGFWNPFDVQFDSKGRLLAPDNDPDSRGPNRLVHVIEGGDYGYESLYGGSGIHPYLAWNGELPGTLPYAVPLGEAPSGMLMANYAGLPTDYRGDALCTIWEETNIAWVDLSPKGTSVTGTTEVLIRGGQRFRPVAMASDSEGNIYITDWVIRQYPVHKRGRIWRLSTKDGVETLEPRDKYAAPKPNPKGNVLDEIYASDEANDFPRLRKALTSDDPFVRTAAITTLSQPVFHDALVQATRHSDADVRVGALLALQRGDYGSPEPVARRLLGDPDPQVRRMALTWVGKERMAALRPAIDRAIEVSPVSPGLFETYLATVRHLQPEFITAYENRAKDEADQIPRELPSGFIESILTDPSRSGVVRATALPHLDDPAEHVELLTQLAREADHSQLRVEAVRSLATTHDSASAEALRALALDTTNPDDLRAEALLALSRQPVNAAGEVVGLLDDPSEAVRVEAARYLRVQSLSEAVRQQVRSTFDAIRDREDRDALRRQLAFVLFPSAEERTEHLSGRPTTETEWYEAVAEGGDPAAGRRVFYSLPSQCSECHTVNNRGGYFGPDLTNVGRSKSRRQLMESILQPSENIAPGWQRWYVTTADGETHYGRQINVGYDDVELYTRSQEFVEYDSVTSYGIAEGSLMPDGLERQLTVDDVRDLIAFLKEER